VALPRVASGRLGQSPMGCDPFSFRVKANIELLSTRNRNVPVLSEIEMSSPSLKRIRRQLKYRGPPPRAGDVKNSIADVRVVFVHGRRSRVSETVAAVRDVTHRVNLSVARNVEHYHGERNHQGLWNELIDGAPAVERVGVGVSQRNGDLGRTGRDHHASSG
jgi:hypothetical protein